MLENNYQQMIPKYTPPSVAGFEERGTDEALAKLYCALAKARASFGRIKRDEEVYIKTEKGSYKFKYAPMENLLEATSGPLAANGIVVMQPFVRVDDKCTQLTVISHESGARLVFSFTFTPFSDVKQFGGQLTYFQRYAYRSALTIAADEDLDSMPEQSRGEVSAERKDKPTTQQTQGQPKEQSQERSNKAPESAPQQASGEHAQRVKDLRDALRGIDLRTVAEAANFVFTSLGVPKEKYFSLGDPLGSALSMEQLNVVINSAITKRAQNMSANK